MICLDELDESFDSFDDLIHWFCDNFPDDDDTVSSEAQAFLKHHFPLIDLNAFWLTCYTTHHKDAGFAYDELHIDYNKAELQRCYPEYFI